MLLSVCAAKDFEMGYARNGKVKGNHFLFVKRTAQALDSDKLVLLVARFACQCETASCCAYTKRCAVAGGNCSANPNIYDYRVWVCALGVEGLGIEGLGLRVWGLRVWVLRVWG